MASQKKYNNNNFASITDVLSWNVYLTKVTNKWCLWALHYTDIYQDELLLEELEPGFFFKARSGQER